MLLQLRSKLLCLVTYLQASYNSYKNTLCDILEVSTQALFVSVVTEII